MSKELEDGPGANQTEMIAPVTTNLSENIEKQVEDERYLDLSAHVLANHAYEYSDKEARAVRRKIDLHLMPVLFFTGMISAVDKIVVSNAALYGMTTDLHISQGSLSWIGAIVAFGLLCGEVPAAYLVQRLRLNILVPTMIVLWGTFTMLLGTAQNFQTIMALRFLLGFAESPIFPSCQIYCVMMYTAEEQPLRISIYLAALASLFVGPVSYGIGVSTGASIATWRLLFITMGGITVLWGLLTFWLLPANPATWRILSEKEKYVAIHRVQNNKTGIENKQIKWYQVREALMDPKTWVLFVYQILIASFTGGLTTFASLIVKGLGYGKLPSVLLGMPTGAMQTSSAVICAVVGVQAKNIRVLTMCVTCLVPLMATALVWKLPASNIHGRLAAYYLCYCFWGAYTLSASLPAQNTSGHSKKVTNNMLSFVAYSVGTIIGPFFFGHSYPQGYITLMCCASIAIPLAASYAFICIWQNKAKDKAVAEGKYDHTTHVLAEGLLDITDREKKDFRYKY
ncbi:putative transporter [Hyphodiscus hymeniophilus]|uniref:Transporter n=1 Tax=Hyphodiscus hymeniophilus TaxID=353542 RepID=A0A9P7B1B8_9HELO|nr:putative transporter [Hyphodiscus hymeniophilus]